MIERTSSYNFLKYPSRHTKSFQRLYDVYTTSATSYRRRIDVETTSCVYWDWRVVWNTFKHLSKTFNFTLLRKHFARLVKNDWRLLNTGNFSMHHNTCLLRLNVYVYPSKAFLDKIFLNFSIFFHSFIKYHSLKMTIEALPNPIWLFKRKQ